MHTIDDVNLNDRQLQDVSSIQSLSSHDPDFPSFPDDQVIDEMPSSDDYTVIEDQDIPLNEHVILYGVDPGSDSGQQESMSAVEVSSESSKSVGYSMDQGNGGDSIDDVEFKF